MIPDDAIDADQDRRVVYVVDENGKVSAKQVRPGPRLHGYRVIREGLEGDETNVINGLMRVRPGARVDPQPGTIAGPEPAARTVDPPPVRSSPVHGFGKPRHSSGRNDVKL